MKILARKNHVKSEYRVKSGAENRGKTVLTCAAFCYDSPLIQAAKNRNIAVGKFRWHRKTYLILLIYNVLLCGNNLAPKPRYYEYYKRN